MHGRVSPFELYEFSFFRVSIAVNNTGGSYYFILCAIKVHRPKTKNKRTTIYPTGGKGGRAIGYLLDRISFPNNTSNTSSELNVCVSTVGMKATMEFHFVKSNSVYFYGL